MGRRTAADNSLAVAYYRVSTDEQHLGPEAQRAAVHAWAASNGVQLVAEHEDLGVSGATPLDKRPGLLAVLASMSEHKAGVLVVAKRDRLARDPLVSAVVEAAAEKGGARVVSAAGEGTDDDSPANVLMRRIVDAFAEYERLVIGARTKAALAVKRAKGERLGRPPFGWRVNDDGEMEPIADEQRALVLIHELRAEGLSYQAIADRLNRSDVPARGKRWYPTTIGNLIRAAA